MTRILAFGFVLILGVPALAGEKDKPAGIVKQRSAIGTVLLRGDAAQAWTMPELDAAAKKGSLLVTLPGARGVFEAKGGALTITLIGNLPDLSSGPVLESVVRLHEPEGNNLDITLERGRVLLENRKTGTAKVRIRIQDKHLDVDLLGKDSAVALEMYSRWPIGSAFVQKPKKEHEPVGELYLFVLKGKADLVLENVRHPIGEPVYFHWDTRKGVEGPVPLAKSPEWIDAAADTSAKAGAAHAAVEKVRRLIVEKGVEKGLSAALKEKSPAPEVAVYSGIAVGGVGFVWDTLNGSPMKETRAAAAKALRHWIDQGQKEDAGLYADLVAKKVKAGQAAIVMELLHGIGPDARNRPETYDALISYLGSDLQAIRELAHRNLAYLVPAGREIGFDASGSADERAKAQAAWRKLIPEGQVPSPK